MNTFVALEMSFAVSLGCQNLICSEHHWRLAAASGRGLSLVSFFWGCDLLHHPHQCNLSFADKVNKLREVLMGFRCEIRVRVCVYGHTYHGQASLSLEGQ